MKINLYRASNLKSTITFWPFLGREWRMASARALQAMEQGPHFSPHSTAKTNDKITFLRKNG